MRNLRFKIATLTAIATLAGVIYLGMTLLIGSYTIHSSGIIGQPITRPLHTDGRYIKDDLGNNVFLRGVAPNGFIDTPVGWLTPPGQSISSGEGYFTWSEEGARARFEALRDIWGVNFVNECFVVEYWVWDTKTTEGGGTTDRTFEECIKDYISIAQEYGIYIVLRPYYVTLAEGWLVGGIPLPAPYGSHDGSLFATRQDFIDFWVDVATQLSVYPNVIFHLWDEPADWDHQDDWFDVAADTINAMRDAGIDNIVMLGWAWCGGVEWVDEWIDGGRPIENVVISPHIYRFHGTFDGEESGGLDIDSMRDFLWRDNDPPGTYPENGRGYGKVLTVHNLPMVNGAIGAAYGASDDDEYNSFKNSLAIMNEFEMGYTAFWFHRSDVALWTLQEGMTAVQPPNRVGQALIDAIAAGA